ncbi:hypothetical protein QMZ05_22615 [Bradyrhizobium sp. INPA03-11B]
MLIFGTGAAGTAGMDETGSEIGTVNVDRNMVQAFEFPKGDRRETGWRLEGGRDCRKTDRGTPSNAFQIAAPGPIRRPDRSTEYGPRDALPQAQTRRSPPVRFPARQPPEG